MCYGMGCKHEHNYTGECLYKGPRPFPCEEEEADDDEDNREETD